MAETTATLRTTLVSRLGLDTTTAAEDARLLEIVNSAVAFVLGDYVPGMAELLVGRPAGLVTFTVSSHSAGSAAITLTASPTDVRRGDILTDSAGIDYLVRSVAGAVVNVGIPIPIAITGNVEIIRRTLALPDHGPVESVRLGDYGTQPLKAGIWGGETNTGTPQHYQQMWDAGESYILLFPAPTTPDDNFVIHQHRAIAKDATIDAPNGVIERILATAIVHYVAWSSNQVGAMNAVQRDSKNLSGESAGAGVYIR